jgi:hypothetical protein
VANFQAVQDAYVTFSKDIKTFVIQAKGLLLGPQERHPDVLPSSV